jgi:excisionase family DNA binding protein
VLVGTHYKSARHRRTQTLKRWQGVGDLPEQETRQVRDELQGALIQARTLEPEELPRLLGELEEVRATALARLSAPAPVAPTDELLDMPEAAARLSLSPDYLYKHAKELPFTRRVGRRVLFSSAGIDAYLKRSR